MEEEDIIVNQNIPVELRVNPEQQLLDAIRANPDKISVVYKSCRTSCISYISRHNYGSLVDIEPKDIYQDAIIVLYEKIMRGEFELTSTFDAYLKRVCRYQLLYKIEKTKNTSRLNDSEKVESDSSITDFLESINGERENQQLQIYRSALEQLRITNPRCYEILTFSMHMRRSTAELASHFGFTEENARNQKARCKRGARNLIATINH